MIIVTATYINYFSDPRAFKIDEGLALGNDVYVFTPIDGNTEQCTANVIPFKLKNQNIVYQLLSFWYGFINIVLKKKPDVVIAHNYYAVFACLILKILYPKAKYIYDSYELYVPSKRNKISKRMYIFYILEKLSIRCCDLVVAANEERARLMKVKFGLNNRPLSLRNISTVFFKPKSQEDIEKEYPEINRIKSHFKLVYQGFLGAGRNTEQFLRILSLLPENFSLLFIGGGPDLPKLIELSKKLNLSHRTVFLGNVPMKDVLPLTAYCDCGLISYPFTDLNNKYCSPNKIYEYPAAGIAMVSSCQSTIYNIIGKYNIACFVNYSDVENSAKTILNFTSTIDKNVLKENIDVFLKENNWKSEFSKFEGELQKLME